MWLKSGDSDDEYPPGWLDLNRGSAGLVWIFRNPFLHEHRPHGSPRGHCKGSPTVQSTNLSGEKHGESGGSTCWSSVAVTFWLDWDPSPLEVALTDPKRVTSPQNCQVVCVRPIRCWIPSGQPSWLGLSSGWPLQNCNPPRKGTPPKFNIAPQKWWLEDNFPCWDGKFSGADC